jgi:hypothetical protein
MRYWYWATSIPTKLVLAQRSNRGEKPVLRIQDIIAKIVECKGVELARSGSSDGVDNATCKVTKLSIEVPRQHAKFLKSVWVWKQIASQQSVGVVGAIEIKIRV